MDTALIIIRDKDYANTRSAFYSHGFTIIEVVLVLAIAGLIFLIVFLALPGLQKSRRDTQRKSDANRLLGKIVDYHGNSGHLPQICNSGSFYLGDHGTLNTLPQPDCDDMQNFGKTTLNENWRTPLNGFYRVVSGINITYVSVPPYANAINQYIVYMKDYKCKSNSVGVYSVTNYAVPSTGDFLVMTGLESGGVYCISG